MELYVFNILVARAFSALLITIDNIICACVYCRISLSYNNVLLVIYTNGIVKYYKLFVKAGLTCTVSVISAI